MASNARSEVRHNRALCATLVSLDSKFFFFAMWLIILTRARSSTTATLRGSLHFMFIVDATTLTRYTRNGTLKVLYRSVRGPSHTYHFSLSAPNDHRNVSSHGVWERLLQRNVLHAYHMCYNG